MYIHVDVCFFQNNSLTLRLIEFYNWGEIYGVSYILLVKSLLLEKEIDSFTQINLLSSKNLKGT